METELSCLTVPQSRGQTVNRHRHIVMTGFDSPTLEAHISRAIPAAFLCQYGSPYNGRAVWEGAIPAGPLAGLSTRTVPLTRLTAGKRSNRPQLEDSIMANNATPTGAIRPQSAPSAPSTDPGSDFRWVREATVIKRIRRKLAERGHSLLITREGTSGRRELGQYVVLGERHQVLSADCKLDSLARFLGVLGYDERVELPPLRGWKWYAGRHRVEIVNGIRFHYVDRLTRDYTSEQALAAAMAKAGITDAAVVAYQPSRISFDGPISGQEGSHGVL